MGSLHVKRFADAAEVIEIDRMRSELVDIGGVTVSHDVHEPGWRWSTHVKPIVGTEWCMMRHIFVVLRGRFTVALEDGTEAEFGPMSAGDIPPRHDAWVEGDEPVEIVSWFGVRGFVEPLESRRERVLTTIVFTDIVDSTGTARRLGERAWGELVAAHESRVRDTLAFYVGVEIKMTGDGVLAIFDGAARAVRCARALVDLGKDLGLEIRAAVHTGEVELGSDDLRGVAVHEASRMLGLAAGGEVLVSATTAALIADGGFMLEDRGEHELRGLDGARRIYAAG